MRIKLDLNCDVGEAFGRWTLGDDALLMKHVSSVNIACGYHAGDPSIMRQTVNLALQENLAIGAHPGFPDLVGFGRRTMGLSTQQVYDIVLYQVGALQAFVHAQGGALHHVKTHGALYNMAAYHIEYAQAIAQAVLDCNPQLFLYALAGSDQVKVARHMGLSVCEEVFADRSYQDDGQLTPRNQPGAVITDVESAVKQVLSMVTQESVRSVDGNEVAIQADTLCIHGDTPNAVAFADQIVQALEAEQVSITAPRLSELSF